MPVFGESIFGTVTFGEGEDDPQVVVSTPLQVELEIEQTTGGGLDIDVEDVGFAGAGDLLAPTEVEVNGPAVTWTASGGLSADPEVVPLGTIVDGGSATWTASGGLSADDPTVESVGGVDIDVGTVVFTGTGRLFAEPIREVLQEGRVFVIAPTAQITMALEASQIRTWRVVDILNFDETIWASEVGFTDGSVSIDMAQDERRSLDLTLDNSDRAFTPSPVGFWYDKILRVRRGVNIRGTNYEFDLGYFMIDNIGRGGNLNHEVTVTGRDYAKKMLKDKIAAPTMFKKGEKIEVIVKALALNAGITRVLTPNTNVKLPEDTTFDADTSRWDIAKEISVAYGYDLFFDRGGQLVMQKQVDPATDPARLVVGASAGNAISLDRSTSDGEMYNHVVAVSSAGGQDLPVWASVENREPSSPTRISRIGRRTKRMESALIKTEEDAMRIAGNFLSVAGLEQFEINFSSLNYPWLDVGTVIEIDDPEAAVTDPRRFLLTSLSVPLGMGPMSGTCKRITVVGEEWTFSAPSETPGGLKWGDALPDPDGLLVMS